jgi:Protein of unknown function (DUF3108)
MHSLRALPRCLQLILLFAVLGRPGEPAGDTQQAPRFPFQQSLSYRIEWHLVNAGTANLEYRHTEGNNWRINLDIESAGLVSRLYRVTDKYTVDENDRFCPASAVLDAQEGKKHTITHLTFDANRHAVDFREHDAVKNVDKQNSLNISDCTHEISGALAALGQLDLAPGSTATIPVTNGKKLVNARIESQAKEAVSIDGKSYNTVRYQAFVFDNVLYKRRGRLFIWLTDDAERTPVQLRLEIGFPIGNILLQLEKQQKF